MIYCIGDSFTFGEELPSRDLAWPAVFGRLAGREITNQGRPGSGNYRIVKRAMDAILNESPEMIILGWTDPGRQEFADENGIYDLWAGRNTQRMDHSLTRLELVKHLTAHDIPNYLYARWLRQIILIQALCQVKNVRCLMFSACNGEQWNRAHLGNHQQLANQINATEYAGWPSNGMTIWCHGSPRGQGMHPLEEGHAITANRIYEHIRTLEWV